MSANQWRVIIRGKESGSEFTLWYGSQKRAKFMADAFTRDGYTIVSVERVSR